MKNKQKDEKFTFTASVLLTLFMLIDAMPRPFEHKTHYLKRFWKGKLSYSLYWHALKRMEEKGWIKIFKKQESEFVKLTKQGELQALLLKARISKTSKWDGKWRLIVYDIPEDSREHRHLFRQLLKQNGFYKLQASVFVSPYPLSRDAIEYLHKKRLDKYIRIARIDQLDNDKDLKKHFKIS